jgi:hypothetical protein
MATRFVSMVLFFFFVEVEFFAFAAVDDAEGGAKSGGEIS